MILGIHTHASHWVRALGPSISFENVLPDFHFLSDYKAKDFPGGSVVKNPPAKQEMQIGSLGWEDTLEKEMATHSSILAWEIPWTEELGGLQSMGSKRVRHDLATKLQQQKIKANHLIMEKMVNVAVKYTLFFALVYAL